MSEQHVDSGQLGYEELYDRAPCGFLSTLPDGTIVRANQTFLDWIKHTRESVVGEARFQTLLTVGARIYYETHYAPLLQMQGFVSEIALEMRRPDGSVCPVVASARQIRSREGHVTLILIALFDSTDRRRYERELLIARKRAEQDSRELADVSRKKTEFIAVLGHELRNPLAPLRNALEILVRSECAPDTVQRTTGVMQRQVAQLVRLVDDLLDASRVGQNKLTLRRVPVDLVSVAQHVIEASEPLLQAAGLTFRSAFGSAAIHVEADAARLIQAIGNVLNNAIKFTPRGGTIALEVDRMHNEALVRIRDTGIGIDEVHLPRVFDLFMQADDDQERRDGLGIGLAIAKNLIERHDGSITVHSHGPGRGTEFVLRLPTFAGSLESVSTTIQPPAPDIRVEARRVLIVDDNRDSAEMMALLLGSFGHHVQLAHDGAQGVASIETFQPHVVLLDIELPLMSGYEVARQIRARPAPQPLLVAVTGWGQDEDRRKSSAAGFDAHLVKPVDHDLLLSLIADVPGGD